MIHVAVLHLAEPSPEGETEQVFASLDGKSYLPISCYPPPGSEDRLAALFEGDGNWRPMTWARRALEPSWWPESAKVTEVEHSTVGDPDD